MKRHPPRWLLLPETDAAFLSGLVRNGRTEQRVARRARILLAMADPSTLVQTLADRVGVSRMAVWKLCRRFETLGVRFRRA
jgi:DNA-binding Lrp family transcriptional regulator